jgi:hypothetical protein
VYAASTDEFGDAVGLTSLTAQKADITGVTPGTGTLAMTGAKDGAQGGELSSSQVRISGHFAFYILWQANGPADEFGRKDSAASSLCCGLMHVVLAWLMQNRCLW